MKIFTKKPDIGVQLSLVVYNPSYLYDIIVITMTLIHTGHENINQCIMKKK